MANAYAKGSNTWLIDTAAATVIDARLLRIVSIKWIGATTAGHTAVVTDAAGGRVWSSVAAGANFESGSYEGGQQNILGLIVPTLASGVLEIVLA